MRILNPQLLRGLAYPELDELARELREELVRTVTAVGGHCAPSLGVVELTFALHRAFDTPSDRLIFDVGHQAYIHKMITGRRAALDGIRSSAGLSGYLKRSESVYDVFGAGHAGTSISAAVGVCLALGQKENAPHVVAIIGDGSLTSGMAYEALNHAGGIAANDPERLSKLIVILNDNQMSISGNVGALHEGGSESAQKFFEALGFNYAGPFDGHDLPKLEAALTSAKLQNGPIALHVVTVKGKGHALAESNPIRWHGIAPRQPEQPISKTERSVQELREPPSFTAVFSETLGELAALDPRVVAFTAAMPTGTGLDSFAKRHPSRFFDVGISEQHAVTCAAGCAAEGLRPVVAIYSTFLQRAYDQVVHDVCIQNLPVLFAIDRGGLVGNDGETHQGLFDIAYLRTLPNMVIMSPRDQFELRRMITAGLKHDGPVAIRFPRGAAPSDRMLGSTESLSIGKGSILRSGTDALLIAFGPMVHTALLAAESAQRELNLSVTVIDARFAKPLDARLLSNEIARHPIVCTLEDHALIGGFGSAVLEMMADLSLKQPAAVRRFGVSDMFVPQGTQEEQKSWNGMDAAAILAFLREETEILRFSAVA